MITHLVFLAEADRSYLSRAASDGNHAHFGGR